MGWDPVGNKGDGTERKIGAYLFVTCFQTSCVSSAMFLTSMAAAQGPPAEGECVATEMVSLRHQSMCAGGC